MLNVTVRFNPRAITDRLALAWSALRFAIGDFCGIGLRTNTLLPLGAVTLGPGASANLIGSPTCDCRPTGMRLQCVSPEKLVVDAVYVAGQGMLQGGDCPLSFFTIQPPGLTGAGWPLLLRGQSFIVQLRNKGTKPADISDVTGFVFVEA